MERVGIVGFLRSIGRSCLSRRRRDSRNERDGLPPLPIPRTTYQETLLAPADIAMNSATKGDEASAISNYPLAIEHYTNALTEMPRAPSYYISRSTAYSRLKPADGGPNFEAALNDAEVALRLAVDRGNRELMIAAQMRRAIALYQLGRLGDASYLFEILEAKVGSTKPSDDKNKEFQAAMAQGEPASKSKYRTELPIWLAKTRRQKPEKPEGDEKWAVTVKEIPDDVEIFSVAQLKDQLAAVKAENTQASARSEETTAVPPQKETPATLVNPDNYRHDWYQKNDTVFVTLHVKNLTDHVFSVKFTETSVLVQISLPEGPDFEWTLAPLYGTVRPEDCTYTFTPAKTGTRIPGKIEMKMPKKTARKWLHLTGEAASDATARDNSGIQSASSAQSAPSAPQYPTSSRKGAKNWDKVADSLGDGANDDDENGDAVDGFFKKLYASADPETRRAMIKSYTESQGTALSTNWSEVGKGKVNAVEDTPK